MSTLAFYAQFTKTLVGVNSLTVTWDVERITRSDGSRSALVTGGATSITIGRRGLYGYLLTGADTLLYDYVATAITAGDVDQKEIAALWTMYEADALKIAGQTVTAAAPVTFPASVGTSTYAGGAVASVSGAVGSIATGGITAASFAADAITNTALATSAVTEIAAAVGGTVVSAADVWAYASRTLTQSAAAVTAAVSGGTISILRGDTFSASFTGLGNVTTRDKLWWTVKDIDRDTDAQAVFQVEETGGLLVWNGAAVTGASTALASITVTNATTGAMTIALDESITDDLMPRNNLLYDVQMLTTGTAVQTLTSGVAHITADVTRRIA